MKHQIEIQAEFIVEFKTFQDWVNKASIYLGGYSKKREILLCIDKEGFTVKIGEDFMASRDFNRFPVKCYHLTRSINTKPNE